jgi:hypothetical protein
MLDSAMTSAFVIIATQLADLSSRYGAGEVALKCCFAIHIFIFTCTAVSTDDAPLPLNVSLLIHYTHAGRATEAAGSTASSW